MKTKQLLVGLALSVAMAVTFIPNIAFAEPDGTGDVQGAVKITTQEETVQSDVDLAESDESLQGYLEKHAAEVLAQKNKKGSAKRKAPRFNRLGSEADSKIYEQLAELARAVAAGEKGHAAVTIDLAELFAPMTADELGVESITDENGSLTEEAISAYGTFDPHSKILWDGLFRT